MHIYEVCMHTSSSTAFSHFLCMDFGLLGHYRYLATNCTMVNLFPANIGLLDFHLENLYIIAMAQKNIEKHMHDSLL